VITRRSILTHSAALLAALSLPRGAVAQNFPAKSIHIIVPFPPGGPADTAVRIAQGGLEKALGQSVIVENVAGAAGGLCKPRARTPPIRR
jgi:tripartite-type tricarboxylate transporter receptor subunit TctC